MAGTSARYLANLITESVKQDDASDHTLLSETILRLLGLPDNVEEQTLATKLQTEVGSNLPTFG